MCEKRQRELHDCEYFEFMDNTYYNAPNHNQCVLKKDITGSRTVTGVRGGFFNECKSKY